MKFNFQKGNNVQLETVERERENKERSVIVTYIYKVLYATLKYIATRSGVVNKYV